MKGRIFVGIGGWNFAPWRGSFYPKGLVQAQELHFASRALTAIEINSTFYGLQKPATTYGRLGYIHCDGQPAIELLEVLAPIDK